MPELLELLCPLARAQCDDEMLVAAAVCDVELTVPEARMLVERHAERLELERQKGKAELLVTQFELATKDALSKIGPAMLLHLGVQYLGQSPGGPDREMQRLLKQLRSMKPADQRKVLRGALGRLEGQR